MTSNRSPLILFIGIILFLLLGYMGIHLGIIPWGSAIKAESKLMNSAQETIDADKKYVWATIEMDGQEIIVKGEAPSKAIADDLRQDILGAHGYGGIAAGGVTVVNTSYLKYAKAANDLETTPDPKSEIAPVETIESEPAAAEAYSFVAIKPESGPIKLIGYVPDMETKNRIIAHAKSTYAVGVIDEITIMKNPPTEDWELRINNQVSSLYVFDHGRIGLKDKNVYVEGKISNNEYFNNATHYYASLSTAPDYVVATKIEGPTEPISDPIVEPMHDSVEAPVEDAATDPATDPVIEPVIEPVTEPVIEAVQEPITQRAPAEPAKIEQADNCAQDIKDVQSKSKIQFASSKAVIRAESYPTLDAIGAVLTSCSNFDVEIIGHTDSTGSTSMNLALSQARAKSVLTYFNAKNIDVSAIKSTGLGESSPIASNSTRAGRAKNRRIEFKISAQ